MANQYLNSQLISKEAVAIFKALNSFVSTGYRKYENMFNENTYKAGDTINVRLDNFYVGARGDSVTAEDIVEDSIPVTIQPLYSVPIKYTPTDLQRDIADFANEFISPAVRRIIAMINNDIYQASLREIALWLGDISSPINSFRSLNQVNPLMDSLNMNNYQRYICLDPSNAFELQSAKEVQNAFTAPLNKEVTMDAQLGRLAGFDILKDSSIDGHISGTHAASGDITVKTAVSSGNTIVVTGLTQTTGTFNVGDAFSLDGVFEYDRIKRKKTSYLKKFTVIGISGAANADGDITLTVYPSLTATGPRQNFIVPGADPNEIPTGTVVNTLTDTDQGYINNIAYTDRGLITCLPPLERMDSPDSYTMNDKESGISLRVSKSAEVLENKNVLRLDAQCAFRWVPNQALRLVSKIGGV